MESRRLLYGPPPASVVAAPGGETCAMPPAATAVVLVAVPAFAQGNTELDLFAADAALTAETTVASIRPATVRETPGIVTIVNRDEIVRSGARDLIDILRTVPGFSFGVDVEGVVDLGFRGVWGHEGKILLLVDGMEMNEQLYGTLQLGRELAVDQIESVEIIRGPGLALYGERGAGGHPGEDARGRRSCAERTAPPRTASRATTSARARCRSSTGRSMTSWVAWRSAPPAGSARRTAATDPTTICSGRARRARTAARGSIPAT